MYRSSNRTVTTILFSAMLLLGACGEESPTSPEPSLMSSRGSDFAGHAMRPVACPTTESYRTEGILGPEGGSLHAAGHRLTVPAGVLAEPIHFTLHAPTGRYVKVNLTAGGAEHYEFAAPVIVTISYDRCRRQHRSASPASVWYIDEISSRPVERMGGKDDRKRRAVTFRTTHFSTYLVAY